MCYAGVGGGAGGGGDQGKRTRGERDQFEGADQPKKARALFQEDYSNGEESEGLEKGKKI